MRKFLGYQILEKEGDINLTLDELLSLIRELIKIEERVEVIKILELDTNRWKEEVRFQTKMLVGT